ncbi:cell division protein FtsK [Corallococcus sp. M34]|uniref:MXAN_5187 family protein n=1 Tax=Citreicoccus inhibens TaxID=2849499 RepID=UPI001C23DCDF|nr:MXAN_5187 family protein [Citreicoccus inhibens]MBU8898390.1 cell division protein FtsK [Citreicoccus inhibens]
MVRLKFLVFALLVLGLGLAHLPLLSEPLRARAVEGAAAQAASGAAEVSRRVEARRAEVQSLALKLAASPDVAAAVQALTPAPVVHNPRDRNKTQDAEPALLPLTAERFAAVRTAAEAAVPKELSGVVIALVAGDARFHARAGGEASTDAAALDVAALAKAGTTVVDAFGAAHAFASVPLRWGGESGNAPAVTLVVGAPLVADTLLQGAADVTGVAALALVQGDKVLGGVGKEKASAEGSLAKLPVGSRDVVLSTGHLQALGPVMLPAFTSGDAMGGKAPLLVGARRALEGTTLEVVAVASTQTILGALASYQQSAVTGLAGLLGLALVWTLLMGSARAAQQDDAQGSGDTLGLSAAMAAQPMAASAPPMEPAPVAAPPSAFAPPAHDPFSAPPPAHAPQPFAAAEPFPFPAPPPVADPFAAMPPAPSAFAPPAHDPFSAPPPVADPFSPPPAMDPFSAPPPGRDPFSAPPPVADPFAGADAFPFPAPPSPAYAQPQHAQPAMPFEPDPMALPPAEAIATAAPRRGAFAFEDQPTAAYSLQQAADPFALAAAQSAEPLGNAETTRVAAIPRELLQASVRPQTSEAIPMPPPRGAAIPLPGMSPSGSAAAVALSEEQHFQEVFREFVTTRERCGEPADGLTYDKFQQKLRKNKEQLVQKYACKTVRFQVYVKEGKAALKATPVKD